MLNFSSRDASIEDSFSLEFIASLILSIIRFSTLFSLGDFSLGFLNLLFTMSFVICNIYLVKDFSYCNFDKIFYKMDGCFGGYR